MDKLTPNSPPIATLQALAADVVICAIFFPILMATKNDLWLIPQCLMLGANTIGLFVRFHFTTWRRND